MYLELRDNLGSSSGMFRLDAISSFPKPFQRATISYCQVCPLGGIQGIGLQLSLFPNGYEMFSKGFSAADLDIVLPVWQVTCQRLAQVQQMIIQCDASSPGWFIEEIWVKRVKGGTWTHFPCSDWLTEADGYVRTFGNLQKSWRMHACALRQSMNRHEG